MPSTAVGIASLKTGFSLNSALARLPSWIASMILRVYLSGQRLPTPNAPPTQLERGEKVSSSSSRRDGGGRERTQC